MKKIAKCFYVLTLCFIGALLAKDDSLSSYANWKRYQDRVLTQQAGVPGWCSLQKATQMMDLIYETEPEICVEIGVFGGSSIYPTASALKFLKKGKVYAIDPWEHAPCLEGYKPNDPNYRWWRQVNLNEIYSNFLQMLTTFDLNPYCVVRRSTSLAAANEFPDEFIDILHIDGNHTEKQALQDAQVYLPKVKKGGYIWFDDANWSTTRAAWTFLNTHCLKDEERSTNEYLLFKKL